MNQTLAKVLYVAGVTTFCTFLGCWAVLAHQENTPGAQSSQKSTARRAGTQMNDENFLRNAAEGNIAEVKFGKLAEEKGQSEEVKKFGKRMVEDHSKANEELKQIGSKEGINMPTDWSHKHAQKYDALAKLSGPEFDKAYARSMVQDHETDINEYKQASTTAKNNSLKQYFEQTLPTLESHLQEAKQMQSQVSREGVSKGKAAPSSYR
jgi:putative membrane protein